MTRESVEYMEWAIQHYPEIVREVINRDIHDGLHEQVRWRLVSENREDLGLLATKDVRLVKRRLDILAAANRGAAKWRAAR